MKKKMIKTDEDSKKMVAEAVAQAVREAAAASAKAVVDAATAAATAQNTAVGIDISYIKKDIQEIKDSLKESIKSSVSISDFNEHVKVEADHEVRIRGLEGRTDENTLVKKLVFGCVTIILVAVVSALIYLVIKR